MRFKSLHAMMLALLIVSLAGIDAPAMAEVTFVVVILDEFDEGVTEVDVEYQWHNASNPPAGGIWSGMIQMEEAGNGVYFHVNDDATAAVCDAWSVEFDEEGGSILPISHPNPTGWMDSDWEENVDVELIVEDNRGPVR